MKLNKHLTIKGRIKDRGSIKWTAMMLPEHIQMLRNLEKEDRYTEKPILDQFDLEAIHQEIQLAYARQCIIEIRLWRDGFCSFSGIVAAIDLHTKYLYLSTDDEKEKISFDEIIGARTYE